jgi:two-component system OmpR family sensor kinase
MSLRLRLLLTLLALAAVGLIVVDAVSYGSLRSHLSERVDQQVASARGPVTVALLARPQAKGARQRLQARGFEGREPAPRGVPGNFEPPGLPAGPGPPEAIQLPPGTYGVLRNASGRSLSHVLFSYGEQTLAAPALPKSIPLSQGTGSPETFTVGERGGGSTEFRAVAFRPSGSPLTAVIAVPLNDYEDTLHHVALIGAIVTASVLVALAILAWWLIRLELKPLDEMGETAGRIAAGDLSQRVGVADPRTEVGRLGVALNSMLGQIEQAFGQREASERRMRRFLADASHELRTPLTSIRGYAELFRIGAARNPDDLDKAMRRIEHESARMGGMVNDLLSLARLDEMPEPVSESVHLRQLVVEACEDARASARDREIGVDAPAAMEILGDADLLRRVVTNLLSNAIEHTPAGTPIEVTLRSEAGNAVLIVRDHGPGISDAAREQVFERFWRESESRGRERGGAGLGLAIVAGVVGAHGGNVRVENCPDGGAVFTVRLPLEAEAERPAVTSGRAAGTWRSRPTRV